MDSSSFLPIAGYGPQPVAFNPTPSDAMGGDLRARSAAGFSQWALGQDAQFRRMTGMLATGLAGDGETASKLLHNSKTGQLIKDSVGMAMQSGLIPGGSPVQLAHSMRQMVGSQGFSLGGNVGMNGQLFGQGAITDQLSKSVYQKVQKEFYDPVSGLGKSAAYGLDKSQMADAANYLTARGAFAGMRPADLNSFTHKEVSAELIKARKEGDTDYIKELETLSKGGKGGMAIKLDKNKMKQVTNIMSDYASTLKDAKDIFGNLPIGELTQNAERLIGASVSEFGSTAAMKQRMASIKATSAAYGINAEKIARNMMNTTDMVQQDMHQRNAADPLMQNAYERAAASTSFGKVAAAISESATLGGIQAAEKSRIYAREQGSKGFHVREFDEQQHSQALAGGLTTIRDEAAVGNKTSLAARSLLSRGVVDPATAAQVETLLAETATGDPTRLREVNRKIRGVLEASGINMHDVESRSVSDLSGTLSQKWAKNEARINTKQLRARAATSSLETIAREGSDGGMLNNTRNKGNANFLMTQLDDASRAAIFGAVNADGSIDQEKLDAAYKDTPGLSDVVGKGTLTSVIGELVNSPGRNKSGSASDQLRTIEREFKSDARNMGLVDDMTKDKADKRTVQAYLSNVSLGDKVSSDDLGTELMRGFFGAGKVTDDMAMRKMQNAGGKDLLNLKLNADKTGLDVKADQMSALSGKIGGQNMVDLYKELGLEIGDKEGLAAALGTSKGFQTLQSKMGDAMTGVTKDGFSIASKEDGDAVKKELEGELSLQQARNIIGPDAKGLENINMGTEEGRAAMDKEILAGLQGDGGKRLLELAGEAKSSNYEGTSFKSLQAMYASNPGLKAELDKQQAIAADAAAKKGMFGGTDEEAVKKLNDITGLKRNLERGEGGAGKFLGILEFATDSLAQLKLFQQ